MIKLWYSMNTIQIPHRVLNRCAQHIAHLVRTCYGEDMLRRFGSQTISSSGVTSVFTLKHYMAPNGANVQTDYIIVWSFSAFV